MINLSTVAVEVGIRCQPSTGLEEGQRRLVEHSAPLSSKSVVFPNDLILTTSCVPPRSQKVRREMQNQLADSDAIKWLLIDRAYSFTILASTTCVLYDHLITLGDEIEFVWKRPKFSVVQILFFINRYGGDALQIYPAYVIVRHIIGRTTQEYVIYPFRNLVQVYIGYLGSVVLFSSQGIMVFRVSSMYGHSRKIITLLALAMTLEITSMVVSQSVANNIHSGVPDPAPGVQICKQDSFPPWAYSIWIPIVATESLLLVLAIVMGFTYHRSETRNLETLGVSSGPPLLFILVRDSLTFPLIGVIICIANLVSWASLPYLSGQITFVFALFGPCVIGSRLVLNLREAYYQPFIEECELEFCQELSGFLDDMEFS